MIARTVLLASFCVLTSACGEGDGPPPQGGGTAEQRPADQMDARLSGYETYQEFCASCHETGVDGAPVTGNQADWERRSRLWVAVLTEHARAGYLAMPAKGGESRLSDLSVSHAVEYMMSETFPDKPAG